ncbi:MULTISPECIES: cytochrome P450 [unclassified Streptomyces]|uniref:cytochrome P450 n=1 Tax=unclassified Streptomyces TaxID=2593676 RepID=UPI00081E93CF|nr:MULTISPECIES: cytochrome P450 [unclassified Streptomyces]MYZ34419.1 cytochrome P450 [Streptomyces sp. SID4917]SCF67267.1 Cytochrome P450 [Streptomyces sp. MnatMP-M17]
MRPDTLFQRITDYANRADPYPLYAELRENGVTRQTDGSYLVGTYHEIAELLHDPRISSDIRNRTDPDEDMLRRSDPPAFIGVDDPEHDRLRRIAMRPFGPPHSPGRIDALRADITRITDDLIGSFRDKDQIDVVDEFAYPLPVTVICRLLGVPFADVPRIRAWTNAIIASFDFAPEKEKKNKNHQERLQAGMEARDAMAEYLGELADTRRGRPTDDMLSALVNDTGPDGRLTKEELKSTATLLLIAGHETTVNLIANGALTLLRLPEALRLLRGKPELMPNAVEELLRYEPPVHMLPQRTPLTDIEVADVTIPKGARLILMLASGNRDPLRFKDPDHFDPMREDNQHFGFGSGIHNCFGAPLARVEAQIALSALVPHLEGFRLAEDPPPYRRSALLRGPRHLVIERK